ncbi:hypothetical protein Glo7428_0814 [Gloeocapsa sp. PCC 7428]|uniref:hypothetical protein n=1 Tax=Gloeocapsa sp. PCC 7428 TaxID=1173026 RepID=UPI0002A5E915|nr:hypothetical protein [Gloeocapsa sp. PCC 7428]AFZ29397.1 hypothetical protein Glo7428_0814 [Gloeocapsa sp. PCC 7428]
MAVLYKDSSHVDRHLESMMASLAHRLEVAKATNNIQLARLLEREAQQLTIVGTSSQRFKLNAWLKNLKQNVAALFASSTPQVHEFVNGSDRWWYTINPRTGEFVYADSEAELRLWIKDCTHS